MALGTVFKGDTRLLRQIKELILLHRAANSAGKLSDPSRTRSPAPESRSLSAPLAHSTPQLREDLSSDKNAWAQSPSLAYAADAGYAGAGNSPPPLRSSADVLKAKLRQAVQSLDLNWAKVFHLDGSLSRDEFVSAIRRTCRVSKKTVPDETLQATFNCLDDEMREVVRRGGW
jgi:hypothetical protein